MTDNRIKDIELIEKHLRKIDYIIRKTGRMILTDFEITVPQFTALQVLINNGDMTIGELSQNMDLACSTITDLIDRMEKTGLVKRTKDINDKRVVRVIVEDKGNEVLAKVLERRIDFLSNKLKDLTNVEIGNLQTALTDLFNEIDEEGSESK
ncbi:MAG: MarR family transcriptional regulator [Gudongella sp.]|jgi:DNA-binding MarR family transcriptional regulator|nr:MarR family transcriptional regulator [Gudongella sp.]